MSDAVMRDAQDDLPNPNPEGSERSPRQDVPIDAESLARHYEQDDVDTSALVRFGVVIASVTVIAATVLWFVLRLWVATPLPPRVQVPPAAVTAPAVPGPGLDAAPEVNLETLMQREAGRLQGYGWVNREAGVVHIPIEEAMRLLVEQGVPARDGDAPDFRLDESLRMDSSGGTHLVEEEAPDE